MTRRCTGGHPRNALPVATVRLIFRAPSEGPEPGPILATEDVCQPCADGMVEPWARAQRTPLLRR